MQLGWFAFEELMMLTSEVAPAEEDDFRERVKSFMQRVIDLGFD